MHKQHATPMTRAERRIRNNQLCYERMKGATLRQLAKRHGLSKSQVHRIVGETEILPQSLEATIELVPLAGGGYTWRHGPAIYPRPRAYKVRNHQRIYPV